VVLEAQGGRLWPNHCLVDLVDGRPCRLLASLLEVTPDE
jgi:hypothetical protein